MTYSVESLVFRVVANVVNSAAWAANGLLEVMWPKDLYEPACLVASGGLAAPCADPHPAVGAADPTPDDAAPPAPGVGSLTWFGWTYPAVVEVLAEHSWRPLDAHTWRGKCSCRTADVEDEYGWHDHVADLIAERIAVDPARAIAALQNLQTQGNP